MNTISVTTPQSSPIGKFSICCVNGLHSRLETIHKADVKVLQRNILKTTLRIEVAMKVQNIILRNSYYLLLFLT